jgi:SpoVK/Ycf46/Vps4 family AAA+-type ATPase
MKKKNVINLIKYYTEKNDSGFKAEAYEIAKDFDKNGDYQLSEYIMALLSEANVFVPQINDNDMTYFKKVAVNNTPLPLPEDIKNDIMGVINAIGHKIGINKFLFEGAPGTGKTETVKQVARILNRELYQVQFDSIIDSKLGQTSKNLVATFDEINNLRHPENVIILFDEIDALALDRMNDNDLREMGRVTSTFLKELDNLSDKLVLIATTNLYKSFDKALIRRFDSIINFNRYSKEELIEISETILNEYLLKFTNVSKDIKLFRKILSIPEKLPYPGDLKNIIKTSLAFSKPDNENDYLIRLYENITNSKINGDIKRLQSQNFTVREIEKLTGISKSQVSRGLNDE